MACIGMFSRATRSGIQRIEPFGTTALQTGEIRSIEESCWNDSTENKCNSSEDKEIKESDCDIMSELKASQNNDNREAEVKAGFEVEDIVD